MTKPRSEPESLSRRLIRFVGLEADAVEACALAACRLSDLGDVEVVGKFRAQHGRQRDELCRLLGGPGGEAFDPFRPRRPLTPDFYLLGELAEDGAMLAVLRDGERAKLVEYEAALRAPGAGAKARNALERGYFGCRTRLQWLERRSRDWPARRPAALASPSRRSARG